MDIVDSIIAYESGDLGGPETLALFSELVRSGAAWSLQGSYGRTAAALIEHGALASTGEILTPFEDLV